MRELLASLPLWAVGVTLSVIIIVVIGSVYAVSRWVWKSPYTPLLGVMGVLLALSGSAAIWSYAVMAWAIIVSIVATLTLFIVGLTRPENKDDPWHRSALGVGAFGPAIGLLALLWGVGPKLTLGSIALVALLILLLAGGTVLISRRRKHNKQEKVEPAPAEATS